MLPEPNALVLIAVINHPRDLEIARVLGWYRIPHQHAPKTVQVDWLAFYQTAAFGADKWSVRYCAPVRGHELTTRAELLRQEADHPRANALYYKLQLGQLSALPRPIPARRWRRVTFLYTTGERLLAAADLSEAVITSAERQLLWQALRERGLPAEPAPAEPALPELDLSILCALGALTLRVSETPAPYPALHIQPAEVRTCLPDVLNRIEQAVNDLGGPAATP